MNKRSIYLCGPMEENSDQDLSWRHLLQLNLIEHFKCNYPMYMDENSTVKEKWSREYFLLDNSDIVLVNLDYPEDRFFLETFLEIGRAYSKGKPIIIVSPRAWVHENETLKLHASKISDNFEDVIDYLIAFYL